MCTAVEGLWGGSLYCRAQTGLLCTLGLAGHGVLALRAERLNVAPRDMLLRQAGCTGSRVHWEQHPQQMSYNSPSGPQEWIGRTCTQRLHSSKQGSLKGQLGQQ